MYSAFHLTLTQPTCVVVSLTHTHPPRDLWQKSVSLKGVAQLHLQNVFWNRSNIHVTNLKKKTEFLSQDRWLDSYRLVQQSWKSAGKTFVLAAFTTPVLTEFMCFTSLTLNFAINSEDFRRNKLQTAPSSSWPTWYCFITSIYCTYICIYTRFLTLWMCFFPVSSLTKKDKKKQSVTFTHENKNIKPSSSVLSFFRKIKWTLFKKWRKLDAVIS